MAQSTTPRSAYSRAAPSMETASQASSEQYTPVSLQAGQLSGYLQKKTKAGRWQKRYFETNGCFLTYYKSRKMSKLLAALNLPQVGDIEYLEPAEHPDTDGTQFTIKLGDRLYTLKAKDPTEARRWVDGLKVLQQGASEEGTGPLLPSDSATDASTVSSVGGGGGGGAGTDKAPLMNGRPASTAKAPPQQHAQAPAQQLPQSAGCGCGPMQCAVL